nr:transcriptional activator RamA [Raoultella sp. NCTC 9187]
MPQDYRAQVFKAIDYISQNLCFNPTLEEIASAVALSSFHFHRIFKAEVGETIAGFTRRLRMEKAAMWLIESPRRDITGLALRVGFSSSQNFAKAFRQHFSVSPGEYRRLHAASVKSKPGNVTGEKSAYSQTEAMKVVRADPDFLAAGRAFATGAAGRLYATIWPLWERDLLADASRSGGLIPLRDAATAGRYGLHLLGCA